MRKKELRWFDIDTANRHQMTLAFAQERRRIVDQLTQIVIDLEHWNELHPHEEPLSIVLDFNHDVVEQRLAARSPLKLT